MAFGNTSVSAFIVVSCIARRTLGDLGNGLPASPAPRVPIPGMVPGYRLFPAFFIRAAYAALARSDAARRIAGKFFKLENRERAVRGLRFARVLRGREQR